MVGQEVAGELAQSMKRVLDVDVAFLLRGRVLAASSQLPMLGQLPLVVDQHFDELAANGRSAPVAVDQGGDGYLVVLAPFVGEAEEHKAAYALMRAAAAAGDVRLSGVAGCSRPIRRRCRGCSWRRSAAACCWR